MYYGVQSSQRAKHAILRLSPGNVVTLFVVIIRPDDLVLVKWQMYFAVDFEANRAGLRVLTDLVCGIGKKMPRVKRQFVLAAKS